MRLLRNAEGIEMTNRVEFRLYDVIVGACAISHLQFDFAQNELQEHK